MEGSMLAPFCPASEGGRFVVDVTGPFLAKFGGMVQPDVGFVAAVMQGHAVHVIAALRPAGGASRSPAQNSAAVQILAGIVGGTPWPQQEDGAGDHTAAAAAIVAGLRVEDVVAQLPQALLDRG